MLGLIVLLQTLVGAGRGPGTPPQPPPPRGAVRRAAPPQPTQHASLVFGLTAAPPCALVVGAAQAAAVRVVDDLAGLRGGVPPPGAPQHAWLGSLLAPAG